MVPRDSRLCPVFCLSRAFLYLGVSLSLSAAFLRGPTCPRVRFEETGLREGVALNPARFKGLTSRGGFQGNNAICTWIELLQFSMQLEIARGGGHCFGAVFSPILPAFFDSGFFPDPLRWARFAASVPVLSAHFRIFAVHVLKRVFMCRLLSFGYGLFFSPLRFNWTCTKKCTLPNGKTP